MAVTCQNLDEEPDNLCVTLQFPQNDNVTIIWMRQSYCDVIILCTLVLSRDMLSFFIELSIHPMDIIHRVRSA